MTCLKINGNFHTCEHVQYAGVFLLFELLVKMLYYIVGITNPLPELLRLKT